MEMAGSKSQNASPSKPKPTAPEKRKSARPVGKKPPVRHNKPEIQYTTESEGETDSEVSEAPEFPTVSEANSDNGAAAFLTPVEAEPSTVPITAPTTEKEIVVDGEQVFAETDETKAKENPDKKKPQPDKKDEPDKKDKNPKRDPIADYFQAYQHNVVASESGWPAFWGATPLPNTGPRPEGTQPPARGTNANTNPPLWEERGSRFKKGVSAPEKLALKLMDQRFTAESDPSRKPGPKKKTTGTGSGAAANPEPAKKPYVYFFERGEPRDWNNTVPIKCLNDRHREATKRITIDPPYTDLERRNLKRICMENPQASIWEIAELFNDRFVGDFTHDEGFDSDELSGGRTIESIRYEYVSHREVYEDDDPDNWPSEGSLEKQVDKTKTVRQKNVRQLAHREIILQKFKGEARKARGVKRSRTESEKGEGEPSNKKPRTEADGEEDPAQSSDSQTDTSGGQIPGFPRGTKRARSPDVDEEEGPQTKHQALLRSFPTTAPPSNPPLPPKWRPAQDVGFPS